MAEYNKGFNDSESVPPQYHEVKIEDPNAVRQPVMYGQPHAPPGAYNQQYDNQPVYGQQRGQVMMQHVNPPGAVLWMDRPIVPGCPPGLEYLTQIDQLLVKQRIELLELLTGYETNNKYDIKNVFGQTVYFAKEDTDCCNRYFCGANRPFIIHVMDNMNQEVILIKRNYKFHAFGHCFSCSECCQDEIEIEAPPGNLVGFVKQLYEGCNIRYSIMNDNGDQVLRIHGPSYFHCYCPGDDYPLSLMSASGDIEVGKISKQWSNLIQEYFTDADNFGIQFPMDLDVKIKAVILGAVFLIDFMFFENNQHRNQNHYN